jgi:hypothetical protein
MSGENRCSGEPLGRTVAFHLFFYYRAAKVLAVCEAGVLRTTSGVWGGGGGDGGDRSPFSTQRGENIYSSHSHQISTCRGTCMPSHISYISSIKQHIYSPVEELVGRVGEALQPCHAHPPHTLYPWQSSVELF